MTRNKDSIRFGKKEKRGSYGILLDGEERAVCFPLFVFLVSHNYCVALPQCVTGLSAVCICGIS